jgi:hypothetical protein
LPRFLKIDHACTPVLILQPHAIGIRERHLIMRVIVTLKLKAPLTFKSDTTPNYKEYMQNSLGKSLMILFISSSNPTSKIRSASSMIKHWRFLNKKSFVFCRWSSNRPGVATRMLIPIEKSNVKYWFFKNIWFLDTNKSVDPNERIKELQG